MRVVETKAETDRENVDARLLGLAEVLLDLEKIYFLDYMGEDTKKYRNYLLVFTSISMLLMLSLIIIKKFNIAGIDGIIATPEAALIIIFTLSAYFFISLVLSFYPDFIRRRQSTREVYSRLRPYLDQLDNKASNIIAKDTQATDLFNRDIKKLQEKASELENSIRGLWREDYDESKYSSYKVFSDYQKNTEIKLSHDQDIIYKLQHNLVEARMKYLDASTSEKKSNSTVVKIISKPVNKTRIFSWSLFYWTIGIPSLAFFISSVLFLLHLTSG